MLNNNEENKILSFKNIFNKLSEFEYIPSEDVKTRIKNPIEAYILETLPLIIKDNSKKERIKNLLRNKYNSGFDYNADIDKDIIQEIFNKYDLNKNFSFMNSKQRRYLFKFDTMWISNEYQNYKEQFINYILSENKFYKHFKHLLQLYIRQYSKLKNNNSFKEVFKTMYKKFINYKKYIPDYIQNIFNDCDLLQGNIENTLAEICLVQKTNTNQNIFSIISDRYKLIQPQTNLFNEIIFKICDICKNKIKEDFYFSLLFDEILCSDIEGNFSGKIVSNIITLFDRDKKVLKTDLEKIKTKLLNNPYYGDPRITKATKYWHYVDDIAKHIFITWLAQADLDFFFKIAFRGIDDKHGRKAFWQKYIKSNQLVESNIIWGQKYYWSEELQEEQRKSNIKYKRFEYEDECSCFILKFNKIYIVEFSEINNALYFYSENEFDKTVDLRRILFSKADDIKKGKEAELLSNLNKNIIYKIQEYGAFRLIHSSRWENLADEILNKLGVYEG